MIPRTHRRTLTLSTDLAAPADAVWQALTSPATLVRIARPLLRFPDLEGRTTPWRQGETIRTRIRLVGVMPLGRHRLTIEELNATALRVQSDEGSALVRSWRHLITVEPQGSGSCRYTDVVEIEAGPLTMAVAAWASGFYRWRQRRWRALARRHLTAGAASRGPDPGAVGGPVRNKRSTGACLSSVHRSDLKEQQPQSLLLEEPPQEACACSCDAR